MAEKQVTVNDFQRMRQEGVRITCLTAYDSLFASLLDDAGVDLILVGDSLANIFQGKSTTIPVKLEEMIYHGEIVARTVKRAFVAVDMPFMSFQVSPEKALENAGRIMKETGCRAVKVEGGKSIGPNVKRIVEAGIPVLGHIGLMPQKINLYGGYGVQGRDDHGEALEDALAIQEAGAFAIVLEKMPSDLAASITEKLTIPTIGIGAGPKCSGQILVTADILGLFRGFRPAFARRYAEMGNNVMDIVRNYIEDVHSGGFPNEKESFK